MYRQTVKFINTFELSAKKQEKNNLKTGIVLFQNAVWPQKMKIMYMIYMYVCVNVYSIKRRQLKNYKLTFKSKSSST